VLRTTDRLQRPRPLRTTRSRKHPALLRPRLPTSRLPPPPSRRPREHPRPTTRRTRARTQPPQQPRWGQIKPSWWGHFESTRPPAAAPSKEQQESDTDQPRNTCLRGKSQNGQAKPPRLRPRSASHAVEDLNSYGFCASRRRNSAFPAPRSSTNARNRFTTGSPQQRGPHTTAATHDHHHQPHARSRRHAARNLISYLRFREVEE